jgi:hypothetical protein
MKFSFFKKNKKDKSTSINAGDFFTDQYRKAGSLGITKIPANLNEQLHQVSPSFDSQMEYYPCRVTLESGEILNNVYVAEVKRYLKVWGILPGEDPAKKSVLISNVIKIEESPNRLPPNLATKLYKCGESGMGYTVFTLVLNNGQQIPIVTGNAIDFVDLPNGFNTNDIMDVIPHEGRNNNPQHGPTYDWCLYED